MSQAADDHLPPPPAPREETVSKRSVAKASALAGGGDVITKWGDRAAFLFVGLLLGFTLAYLYLEKAPASFPQAVAGDPHAGLTGVGPGATRDLPGAGGGALPISTDPAVRQTIRELEQAVAKDPKSFDLLVKLGNAAFDADDHRQAADAYERALEIRADDPNVLTDLGVSYRNLGDLDRALSFFEKAIKLSPGHWQATYNKAIVLGVDKGEVAKAREILAKLKKENPGIPALEKLDQAMEEKARSSPGK